MLTKRDLESMLHELLRNKSDLVELKSDVVCCKKQIEFLQMEILKLQNKGDIKWIK